MPRPEEERVLLGAKRSAQPRWRGSSRSTFGERAGRWRSAFEMLLLGFGGSRPRILASTRVSRYSAASWVVKALVDATPISGPARVRNRSRVLRTSALSGTLQIASVRSCPSDLRVLQRGDGVGRLARTGRW